MPVDFLLAEVMGKPVWMWAFFLSIVAGLLVFDLGVLHRDQKEIGIRDSLMLSAFYIAVGLGFGLWVAFGIGEQKAAEYYTGFVVEKTLAMDNVFVIAMIFSYFSIPRQYQHRVLFWGILGVILLRGIMIGVGAALVESYSWILTAFAVFLVITGIRMLMAGDHHHDIGSNPMVRFLTRNFRVTKELHGDRFFVRLPANGATNVTNGRLALHLTPLFLALVSIEIADVIFAVDSVPAIFAITTDPYIVYTSNIFAILGLRALFFALAAMIERFRYLKYALSLVLVFIGAKVLAADFFGIEKIPVEVSLPVTVAIIGSGIAYSLWRTARPGTAP